MTEIEVGRIKTQVDGPPQIEKLKRASAPPQTQLVSIQVLRGVAAMMVVAFHLSESVFFRDLKVLPIFNGGLAGVDVFFVISGFVMWVSTERLDTSPAQFWRARIVRVVPLYYLSTLVFLAVVVAAGRLPAAFSVREIILSFLFVPFENSLNGQPVPILGVGWTLNYEAFFYLIFGLALLARVRTTQIALLTVIFGVLIVGRFVLVPTGALAFRMTSPLYLEFLAGIFCGVWVSLRAPRDQPILGAALVVIGLGSLAVVSIGFPALPRTLGFGIPAIFLVCGFVLCEKVFHYPCFGLPRIVGDASYSIYLIHGIVIYTAAVLAHRDVPLPIIAAILVTIAAPGAGLLCYIFIEKPILAAMRNFIRGGLANRNANAETRS